MITTYLVQKHENYNENTDNHSKFSSTYRGVGVMNVATAGLAGMYTLVNVGLHSSADLGTP